jgi:hypothetical protein
VIVGVCRCMSALTASCSSGSLYTWHTSGVKANLGTTSSAVRQRAGNGQDDGDDEGAGNDDDDEDVHDDDASVC